MHSEYSYIWQGMDYIDKERASRIIDEIRLLEYTERSHVLREYIKSDPRLMNDIVKKLHKEQTS